MRKNLLLLFVSFLIATVTVESVLRILHLPERGELLKIGWNTADIYPDMHPLNQLGFRGKNFPDTVESTMPSILLLGDSQVEANGLPYIFTLEYLLQELLQGQGDIFSIGSGGYGQDQQLLALQHFFKHFSTNHVVLWFTPENDVWNNLFPTHWPWNGNPKPSFYLNSDSLVGPNFDHRYSFSFHTKIHLFRILGIMTKTFSLKSLDTKWAKKMPEANSLVPIENADPATPLILIGAQEELEQEKSHYAIYQEQRSVRMNYGIKLTRKLLENIQSLCRQNGASFSIFYLDNQFVLEMPDRALVSTDGKSGLIISKTKYYETVEEILAGFQHRHIPLQAPWRAISLQDRHHLNHQAQQELAESISPWLLELFKETIPTPATSAPKQTASKAASDL